MGRLKTWPTIQRKGHECHQKVWKTMELSRWYLKKEPGVSIKSLLSSTARDGRRERESWATRWETRFPLGYSFSIKWMIRRWGCCCCCNGREIALSFWTGLYFHSLRCNVLLRRRSSCTIRSWKFHFLQSERPAHVAVDIYEKSDAKEQSRNDEYRQIGNINAWNNVGIYRREKSPTSKNSRVYIAMSDWRRKIKWKMVNWHSLYIYLRERENKETSGRTKNCFVKSFHHGFSINRPVTEKVFHRIIQQNI